VNSTCGPVPGTRDPGIFMLMNKFLAHSPRICDKPKRNYQPPCSPPHFHLLSVAPFGFSSFVLSTLRLAALGHLSAKPPLPFPLPILGDGVPVLFDFLTSTFKWISDRSFSGAAVGPPIDFQFLRKLLSRFYFRTLGNLFFFVRCNNLQGLEQSILENRKQTKCEFK